MKSVEFCYWLQGLFELGDPKQLDTQQTELIKRHLAMVFHHEIDPSYGATQQAKLTELHDLLKIGSGQTSIGGKVGDVIYRC